MSVTISIRITFQIEADSVLLRRIGPHTKSSAGP